ncbi:MAG: aminoacetone oxidase family FAD-binding enzyme [Bacilli bacterium]|nr:aminoacetone oxidase family FAD-binding enzyme [Bacilli bacterium]
MKKIVIVGGGISGLVSALTVKGDNNEVIILEKNSTLGKKILVTGNGRCNFLNDDFSINHFHSVEDADLSKYIKEDDKEIVLNFVKNLGIEYKIKNGYYYPFSNKASTIKDTLVIEVERNNIKVIYNYDVRSINKEGKTFVINNDIKCDYVILSTGSKSYPVTGSTGEGYELVKKFRHGVTELYPSLVQVTAKGDIFKKLSGIRTDVKVGIYNKDKLIKEEIGELQLTDYGISGICVFNLSRYVPLIENPIVKIDFLPNAGDSEKYFASKPRISVEDLLLRTLNDKLVKIILEKSNIDKNSCYQDLDIFSKQRLLSNLREFEVVVTGTKSFDSSQVTAGGVKLIGISDTFESTLVPNLYIIGELLDIDGDCGGYNISFAIISAIKAGNSIRGKND